MNSEYDDAVKTGKVEELLDSLNTRFVLLYFRGMSYYTTLWNQPARAHHRKLNEVGRPLIASAALNAAGITIDDVRKSKQDDIEEKASPHAGQLIEFSKKLRREKDVKYPEWNASRSYSSALTLFHEIYTTNYDLYPKFLEDIKSGIVGNPLLSTGETPRHPFNYALGNKVYAGHEDKRLRPRYNGQGRCERPHSGKVYYLRMPLKHLASTAMVSIPQLNYKAEIAINLLIISERESSFWGMIPKEWVVGQTAVKYPSFHKKYKPKYLEKYGLTKEAYDAFSLAHESFAPHTEKNKLCKLLLGTYLSAFYEQKAMRYCLANANGAQPVFYTMDGRFSFELERDSPNRNGTPAEVKEKHQSNREKMAARLAKAKPRKIDFSKEVDEITAGVGGLGL